MWTSSTPAAVPLPTSEAARTSEASGVVSMSRASTESSGTQSPGRSSGSTYTRSTPVPGRHGPEISTGPAMPRSAR